MGVAGPGLACPASLPPFPSSRLSYAIPAAGREGREGRKQAREETLRGEGGGRGRGRSRAAELSRAGPWTRRGGREGSPPGGRRSRTFEGRREPSGRGRSSSTSSSRRNKERSPPGREKEAPLLPSSLPLRAQQTRGVAFLLPPAPEAQNLCASITLLKSFSVWILDCAKEGLHER